jgi:PBSX family phage terminase large subunit
MVSFKKTPKQTEAIDVLTQHKYTALYGGSRSGKSFILIYGLIVRACKAQSRHAIVRATFNAVKRSVFLDTLPKVLNICFPDLPIKWNKTDYYITLPNGSEIWLFGLDDKRADRILGMEFSTIFFNEASELDYSPIQNVISRLAQKNILEKRVWYDFNPPSKAHWSYWLFIKKVNPADEELLTDPEMYAHFLMNPVDNIDNIDEEYLKILERMPKEDRERFLNGLFSDVNDGVVYYAFNRERHVAETQPEPGTMFIGRDFNVNPMTCVVFQYLDNKFYIHDEIFLKNSDTYRTDAKLIEKGYRGGVVIPDSTAHNRKTSGKSDVQIMKDNGFTIERTRNPFITDRINNVNRLFSEDRVIINPRCKYLINDLNKVAWKDNKPHPGADKMLTHISDALGYGFWKLEPIGRFKNKVTVGGTI